MNKLISVRQKENAVVGGGITLNDIICRVAPDTELARYPANFLPDIRYPAEYPAD